MIQATKAGATVEEINEIVVSVYRIHGPPKSTSGKFMLEHATAEMQRLSNTEMVKEPPKTDAAWQEWNNTRELHKDRISLDDEQAREE